MFRGTIQSGRYQRQAPTNKYRQQNRLLRQDKYHRRKVKIFL